MPGVITAFAEASANEKSCSHLSASTPSSEPSGLQVGFPVKPQDRPEFAQKAKMHSYDYDELIEDAAYDGVIIGEIQYL